MTAAAPATPARTRKAPRALLTGLLIALATCAPQPEPMDGAASVGTIASPAGAQNLLFLTPRTPPRAVVVMLPGGDGAIGIQRDGGIQNAGNFLIRTRARWMAAGLLYVAVDGSGEAGRVGPGNRQAAAEIVNAVRSRSTAPIWFVGTSAGAPAALDAAASLPQGSIAGAVVSSPVTVSGPRETVFDAPLDRIAVPVLIQVHRNDACPLTPPGQASALKAAMSHARSVDVQQFQGGSPPRSRPCQAASAHGFLGIEDEVVRATVEWIAAH